MDTINPLKLKCGVCDQYLSHFPIYLTSKDENICGRCHPTITVDDETKIYRNDVYETTAQLFKFSCRFGNEGCLSQFYPRDIPNHEETCSFRIVPCPVKKCEWKGAYPTVIKHCHDEHCDMFLKDNLKFDVVLTETYQRDDLLVHDQKLLIFKRKFDVESKILECAVSHCPFELDIKVYSCQVDITSGAKQSLVGFETSSFDDVTYSQLLLLGMSQNQETFGEIRFDGRLAETRSKKEVDWELLSCIRCNICGDFVMPPFFEPEVAITCFLCLRKVVIPSKDSALGNMANLLNYPCKNYKQGCSYVSKPDQMKKHQPICQFGEIKCPVNPFLRCPWKHQRKDIVGHLESEHQRVIENFSIFRVAVNADSLFGDIMKFENHYFRVLCLVRTGRVCFSLEVIDFCNTDCFKYIVELVDVKGRDEGLYMKQRCLPFTEIWNVNNSATYKCYFYKDQISNFVKDNELSYRVSISQHV